jgi:hypothetical protein
LERSAVLSLPFGAVYPNCPVAWILDTFKKVQNSIGPLPSEQQYQALYPVAQEWDAALSSIPLIALGVLFVMKILYKK